MITTLTVIQIIVSILLVISVLLQTSAAGLGGAFGGSDVDSSFHTRRGFEKTLFRGTVILAILFAVISFIIFLIS